MITTASTLPGAKTATVNSYLRFTLAINQNPDVPFRFAEKQEGGTWGVKNFNEPATR